MSDPRGYSASSLPPTINDRPNPAPLSRNTAEAMGEVILHAQGLTKRYAAIKGRGQVAGAGEVELFRNLNLEVRAGEMVAIIGESGAGKSSLLHLLAALDRPTSGEVWCRGRRLAGMSAAEAAVFRNREIGYLWQFHYLLPEFTAAENVAMPLLARGTPPAAARQAALDWLSTVGLAGRSEHRSGELSGGEQQRVSLARALVTQPAVLLADEPTGDLDETTAEAIFRLLLRIQREHRLAAVLVTHHLGLARRCDRMLALRNQQLLAAD